MMLGKRCLLAVPFLFFAASGIAQTWPAPGRELKIIVGYPAGSGADTGVRYVSAKLAEVSGHPVIVENRAGMISSLGADAVAKAKPDGYTILLASVTSSHAANLVLFKKLPYDPVKDFTPVTTLYRTTFFLMVNAKSPHRTVAELTAAMRAAGNKASYGFGSPPALAAAELYKHRAGLQAVGISYKTSAATLPEMYSGALDFQFIDANFGTQQLRGGKLRALAIVHPTRSPVFPNLPTIAEAGFPGYHFTAWFGIVAPSSVPRPIITALNQEINRIMTLPEVRERLANMGGVEVVTGTPERFASLIQSETETWGKLVRQTGAKID